MLDRVPLRLILDEAAHYCQSLTAKEERHRLDIIALKKHHINLLKRIALLQRHQFCSNKKV